MSAFIVNYSVINNILSIAENHELMTKCCYLKRELTNIFGQNKYGFIDEEILNNAGQKFLELNIDSVNYRYNEEEDYIYAEEYRYKNTKASLIQAIKSLNCLMYQSCEIENYKENPTYKKMERLKKLFIDTYFYTNEEYKQAQWG